MPSPATPTPADSDSASPNDVPASAGPTTAAERAIPPPRPACTRGDGVSVGGADGAPLRAQSADADAHAHRTATEARRDALTARQTRELGEMRAAVDAAKAEVQAVQAELAATQAELAAAQAARADDSLLISALRQHVVALEDGRRGGRLLGLAEAAERRLSARAVAGSVVLPTRLA